MNARSLAQTLLRVWGLILIISALLSIGSIAMFFTHSSEGDSETVWRMSTFASCIHIVLSIVAGALLVRHGDRVGAWLVSDIAIEGEAPDAYQIQIIAFSIVGLYFLINGVRDIGGLTFTLLTKPKWDEMHQLEYLWDKQQQALVGAVVNIVAGLLLLFRREGIARASSAAWRAIRNRDS